VGESCAGYWRYDACYDLINADANPFAAQMAFLGGINESHNVLALGAQDMLREGYLNPASGGLSGISAMPSLHNAPAHYLCWPPIASIKISAM